MKMIKIGILSSLIIASSVFAAPIISNSAPTTDIIFQSSYGGTAIATPEKLIVPKDSDLKLYFQVKNYSTFEYAVYQVPPDQQSISGTYIKSPIRGAFTSDVEATFIGINLTETKYKKGDILVIKFRATSVEGEVVQKSIRVLLGDEKDTISELETNKIPTSLQ